MEMQIIFSTIELLIISLSCFSFYKAQKLFFEINAKRKNRNVKSYYKWINLNPWGLFSSEYSHLGPISFLLHKIDSSDFDNETDEVKALFLEKYKYEKLLFILSITLAVIFPLIDIIFTYVLQK